MINSMIQFQYIFYLSLVFFFYKQGERTCIKGIIDIPTRLALRETSILCRQTLEKFIKKGGKITKVGGTRPKPSMKTNKKTTERNRKNTETTENRLWKFVIR
jgi:hypothetical protein